MDKNVLILKDKSNKFEEYFSDNMKSNNIDISVPFRDEGSGKLALIRRVHCNRFIRLPFPQIWFNIWKKNIKKYDLVIIFGEDEIKRVLEYIYKKNKKTKVAIWNWNKTECTPKDYRICKYWSFDPRDCNKFGWEYNHQFYLNSMIKDVNEDITSKNVFFIGADKNRLRYINKIEKILHENNINTNFFIVADKNKDYEKNDNRIIYQNWDYLKVLNIENKSYCLLDINKEGQEGLTLRTLEALLFKKKLITNNKFIIQYDFYNPNNIFIIGYDNINNLNTFLQSEFVEIDIKVINKYSYDNWIENFIKYYFN